MIWSCFFGMVGQRVYITEDLDKGDVFNSKKCDRPPANA